MSETPPILGPAPTLRTQAHELSRSLERVRGSRLLSVHYALADFFAVQTGPGGRWVHDVWVSVGLAFTDRSIRIDWAMDGYTQGLAALVMAAGFRWGDDWTSVDASGTPLWTPYVGSSLGSVACSWFDTEPCSREALLSVRFSFRSGNVVIVLGQVGEGCLSYLPMNCWSLTMSGSLRDTCAPSAGAPGRG